MSRLLALIVASSLLGAAAHATEERPAFLDPDLSPETRATDIVARLTLAEKVAQMMNEAPGIPRLGIPAYNWWNECLHGVARAGYATVFPQSITVAASFDRGLMRRIGAATSDEARAKYHDFQRRGRPGIYHGLTFWSPNINIFRDPRWGRGHETYGEDPYLTGQLATAFIRGLQGDDPRYYKVIATSKHYAVHSGPEPLRHTFDVNVSDVDLWETYLAAFRTTVEEGHVHSIMGAYNRVRGVPATASPFLLEETLRKAWGFDGYVVSDCGAINDIYAGHKVAKGPVEAAALGAKNGCDLECGWVYRNLPKAVEKGLIAEADIDRAVTRLFEARIRLGMFDPEEKVPYASIPMSVVGSEKHRALAREAAQKSIVLLKNDGGLLPLDASQIKRIAVIGPNADNFEALLGNYHGIPREAVTVLEGIRRRVGPAVDVAYVPGSHLADGMPNLSPIPVTALRTSGGKRGLTGEYFGNARFASDPVLVRDDPQVDFYWEGGSPAPELPDDDFSIRWRGFLVPPVTGEYRIGTWAMPAIQVRLDGKVVVRFESIHHALHVQSPPLALEAGKPYPLEVHYRNTYGDADARLLWSPPEPDMQDRALRLARTADVVVLVLGLSQRLEGEEMPIEIDGFKGGDRVHLRLPRPQDDLLRAVADTGKPVVVVMMNGSAIAIHSAVERAGAVLMAGYPGEQGGNAVADVLFGDVSPAGRLPVTWYRSVEDLPPFDDYAMRGRTYRYFEGQPLFPFGFGLSYTRFTYAHLQLPARAAVGEPVAVAVDVTNSGDREGDEVVELYVTDEEASTSRPIRQLEGVERVHLAPGETRTVRFTLEARQLSLIDAAGNRVIEPGAITVAVGGKQPGFTGAADSPDTQVLTGRLTLEGQKVTLADR